MCGGSSAVRSRRRVFESRYQRARAQQADLNSVGTAWKANAAERWEPSRFLNVLGATNNAFSSFLEVDSDC